MLLPTEVTGSEEAAVGVRDRLLDAADHLFYTSGIAASGVDKISARAGVGKMGLYHHFGSKDGLIAAYLSRRDRIWREALSRRLADAGPDPAARLHMLVAAYEERVADQGYRGCAFLNAAAELPATHPAWEVLAEHKRQIHQQLGQDLAEVGANDPEALAARLFTLLEGLLAVAAIEPAGPAVRHAGGWAHRLIDDLATRPQSVA